MTLQSIFEQSRERLTSAVSGTDTVSAIRILTAELDRILYTFNDQEENDRVREAAGSMIQVAKAACTLVDSSGEATVYGRTEYGKAAPVKGKLPKPALLLLILGLIAAAVTLVGIQLLAGAAAAGSADWQSAGLPPRWVLAGVPLLAMAALFFAGLLFRRRKAGGKETLYAETKLDADKVCSRLLSMILVMDKCLEDIRNAARQEEKNRLKEQAAAMDPAELELLSRLLEDAYARKGTDEQAEEEIAQIRFYLHRKSVDVVDWTGDKPGQSGWFDMMPAFSGGTLRPALIADGVLLKKGLASAGRG